MFLLLALVAAVFSQKHCFDSGLGPCLDGTCPTGMSCVENGTLCCNNSKIFDDAQTRAPESDCLDNPKMNCASFADFCNESEHYVLLAHHCPVTCDFCSDRSNTTDSDWDNSSNSIDGDLFDSN